MDSAPIIGGLAGLASGILNFSSAQAANAEARRQFDESMKFNRENMNFQRYQYENGKQYQSYKNQLRMMREAGLNPALMFGAGASPTSVAQVGGVSAPSSNASYQMPDFSGLPSAAAAFGSMVSQNDVNRSAIDLNYANASKSLQESIGTSIKNLYEHGNQQLAQTYQKYLNSLTAKDLEYQTLTLDDRVEQQRFSNLQTIANYRLSAINLKHADNRQQQEIALIMANKALAYANRDLSLKEAHESFMRTIAKYGLTKEEAHDMFLASLDFIQEEGERNRSTSWRNYIEGGRWKIGPAEFSAPASIRHANRVVSRNK